MFTTILFTIFVVSATAWESILEGYEVGLSPQEQDLEDDFYQYLHQHDLRRQTRQIHGGDATDKRNFAFKLPIASNNQNAFSALGAANLDQGGRLAPATGGFAFDNINGNKLSLTETYIPKFGHQVTAAGQANLIHNTNHNLNANGFITRNLPTVPQVPNFNTFGGGLDYKFKNKIGASVGVTHTPLLKQTDFSANGNFDIFRRKNNALNLSGGISRSFSPISGNSPWSPTGSLTYTKWF